MTHREDRATAAAEPQRHYERHLRASAEWLLRSIDHGRGGSCAYFSPLGWSRPYPETSGYIIPTLISLAEELEGFEGQQRAISLGEWLLGIQSGEGWWRGGVHPPKGSPRPSVFNTAQVLHGMTALHDLTGESRWLDSGVRAGQWLAKGLGKDGLWGHVDYRAPGTPSYYTFAAWPMLEVAARVGDNVMRAAAVRVLDAILARRRPNGTFARWAFEDGKAAFTHTIAYTTQGLIESARLLDDWASYGAPTVAALEELARHAEGLGGRLPGRFDNEWAPAASSVCLTGNAQTALCLLDLEARRPDARLLNIAVALTDAVCDVQRLRGPGGLKGAVAGSSPPWGRYMTLRWPNWAAKFHCDALIRLRARLRTGLR